MFTVAAVAIWLAITVGFVVLAVTPQDYPGRNKDMIVKFKVAYLAIGMPALTLLVFSYVCR